ncbi:MAG: Trk system potassium transporter TrkA [Lachnospiraceae bacterium]|nr:Trk system potassium transporter TrkA [Lachnospiraceae bacterium]
MKITVIGLGKFGYEITGELVKEKHDITVIDINGDKVSSAITEFDVIGLVGNGASGEILAESGIKDCDIVISLTASDELNLLAALIAKKLGAKKAVARVRNPEYSQQTGLLRESLDVSVAINPEMEAANEISRVIRFPSAMNVESFAAGDVDIVSFSVEKQSVLCGKTVREIFAGLKTKTLICAVSRGGTAYIPDGDFVIEENDVVAVISRTNDISGFFREVFMPVIQVKNIMIIGAGKIAYYLLDSLLKLKMHVIVVEKDEKRAEEISYKYPAAKIICGDGTDPDVLADEGIDEMDALCCLTGIDEVNVLLSTYAKSRVPGIKTITKINRISYEGVINRMNIGTVIYPKQLAGNIILQYVRGKEDSKDANYIENLYRIIDNKVEALEFLINDESEITGKKLVDLKLKDNVLIGCILRDSVMMIPHGNDMIMPKDKIIVVTTLTGISRVEDILRK